MMETEAAVLRRMLAAEGQDVPSGVRAMQGRPRRRVRIVGRATRVAGDAGWGLWAVSRGILAAEGKSCWPRAVQGVGNVG